MVEIHSTIVRKFFSGSPDCKRHYPVMTLPAAGTPALVEDEIAEELGCGLQRLGQQLAARLDGRANLLLVVDVAAVDMYTRWETGTDCPTGVGVQLKATSSTNGWESGGDQEAAAANTMPTPTDSMEECVRISVELKDHNSTAVDVDGPSATGRYSLGLWRQSGKDLVTGAGDVTNDNIDNVATADARANRPTSS